MIEIFYTPPGRLSRKTFRTGKGGPEGGAGRGVVILDITVKIYYCYNGIKLSRFLFPDIK